MPKFESHCMESMALFGASFSHVHLWLDEFHGSKKYKSRHSQIRHYQEGVQMAVVLFCPECEPVARQHIISDLQTDGFFLPGILIYELQSFCRSMPFRLRLKPSLHLTMFSSTSSHSRMEHLNSFKSLLSLALSCPLDNK